MPEARTFPLATTDDDRAGSWKFAPREDHRLLSAPMKRHLVLLRHANAQVTLAGGDDHERPLDARGRQAATAIGAHLARDGYRPSLALCSSARRAVETLTCLRTQLGGPIRVQVEKELYLATGPELLTRLSRLEDSVGSVLLVGHSPGLAELASVLAGGGKVPVLRRLRSEFPTAAFAALRLEFECWRAIAPRVGTVTEFTAPRDLA